MYSDNQHIKEPIGWIMSKLSKFLLGELQHRLADLDISRSYYPLLLIDSRTQMTQQELAYELSCDKVQVVRIVDYLSSKGYVERVIDPNDRRKHQLIVTGKARKVIPEIKNVVNDLLNISFQGFSPEQVDLLYEMLENMERNLISK
ncbi:MAG: MarR family transcriptional regulator [Paludibacteraceae bacterium]